MPVEIYAVHMVGPRQEDTVGIVDPLVFWTAYHETAKIHFADHRSMMAKHVKKYGHKCWGNDAKLMYFENLSVEDAAMIMTGTLNINSLFSQGQGVVMDSFTLEELDTQGKTS